MSTSRDLKFRKQQPETFPFGVDVTGVHKGQANILICREIEPFSIYPSEAEDTASISSSIV